jgi:hypothetical protein
MKIFIRIIILVMNSTIASAMHVEIGWEYQGLPAEMSIREIDPARHSKLWDTGKGSRLADLPVGRELKGSMFDAAGGTKRRFVLVYHNQTTLPIYFFAAPHAMLPARNALGAKFKCLCVNKAYEVAPQSYWFRVVELRLDSGIEGDNLKIVHQLIAITKEQKEKFNLDSDGGEGHSMDGM